MVANPQNSKLKRPPNQNELAFIRLASKTRSRAITQEEIDKEVDGRLRTCLTALQQAITEGGEEDFWKAWEVLERDGKVKPEWRKPVEVPAPQEETSQTTADERIITGKKGQKVFKTLTMSEVKRLPRAEWQVPGVYQKVSVSLTYGDANTGKTFVDLDIALHIAYGMNWQERRIKQGRVLYIYGEGNEGLANRIEAWQRYHNKPDTDAIQFICFPVQLLSELDVLCATIEEQDEIPSMIVIDTFSVCAEGIPENDNVEVAHFISCASHIKRTYKTHVHIIHHAGKNGDYRGAAAFRGNVDTMILLSRESQDAPIIVTCKKQKDAPYFSDIRLQLEQITLWTDEESLLPVTSCVVTTCDTQTYSEEKREAEYTAMVNILIKNTRMSTDKWKKACAEEANISRNSFYDHKSYLVQTGRVTEEVQGPGKPVFYSAVEKGK